MQRDGQNMKELTLSKELVEELEGIYEELQNDYHRVAEELDFSCDGCPDNCCDSYFLHHTYAEWAYLWQGVRQLESARQQQLVERAKNYLNHCQVAIEKGQRPRQMCPINDGGLCGLYKHRLLVCRTHGVPARMTRPDGQVLSFPGCFRVQEMIDNSDGGNPPAVERTPALTRLALLENELLQQKRHLLPRVKMTIAEMLVKGPPTLPLAHCQKKYQRI
jgi:Fe-S-cluster containining protein